VASCHEVDKGPIRERDSDAAKHLEWIRIERLGGKENKGKPVFPIIKIIIKGSPSTCTA
jgi:hypothetical protein